jgi:hypothetical protein
MRVLAMSQLFTAGSALGASYRDCQQILRDTGYSSKWAGKHTHSAPAEVEVVEHTSSPGAKVDHHSEEETAVVRKD